MSDKETLTDSQHAECIRAATRALNTALSAAGQAGLNIDLDLRTDEVVTFIGGAPKREPIPHLTVERIFRPGVDL